MRIEVKASGCMQGKVHAKPSAFSFGRVSASTWEEYTNEFRAEPQFQADVFGFAVQICRDHALYGALDAGQWQFHVVPAHAGSCVRLQETRHQLGAEAD